MRKSECLLALPNTADPFGLRDRTILELFYATGIRRTEMTRLDHGDYDPAARTLLVRKGKAGKSRLLPVGERAAWWLERYLAGARPLFSYLPNETALFLSGYGTRFSPAYLGNWVAGLMKKAGIPALGSCHRFRHSCATGMLEGGADIRYIQEMLGHEQLTTTQIYTHVSIKALAEVHARCHPHGRMPRAGRKPRGFARAHCRRLQPYRSQRKTFFFPKSSRWVIRPSSDARRPPTTRRNC